MSLIKLLRLRHAEDVFISECKDGPSLSGSHFRLDGWAMRKSWSHPTTFGYECKESRNDFLRDDKWQNYLPLCSDFYFVCPWGMIEPHEVGPGAGLLWASRQGGRLWEKKKAPRRQVDIPESMWRYIVMRLDPPRFRTTAEEWREWLEKQDEELKTGRRCSERLRRMIADRIYKAETNNTRLESENEKLADVKKLLDDLGVSLHSWNVKDKVRDQLASINAALPAGLVSDLERVRNHIDTALERLKPPLK